MANEDSQYIPSVKWRQGEYQALFRLKNTAKDGIIPLINIPPIEYDFEEKRMKKTVQEHIAPFPKRYKSKWGERSSFIDFDESLHDEFMDSGESAISYVFDGLNELEGGPVPVTGLNRSKNFQMLIRSACNKNTNGLAIRIKLEELMRGDLNKLIQDVIKFHKVSYEDIDIIIDLGKPKNFEPYDEFAEALTNKIKSISNIESFRSFIVLSTSISMTGIKKPGAEIRRHEWSLYKALISKLKKANLRTPKYGDYCIETPNYTQLDMRFVNAAGKVVYTTEDSWFVRKGSAFRGNESQMVQHCTDVVDSEFFKGDRYSWGDKVIKNTADGLECSKSRTIWKQVGFSHHLTFVVEQLSSFHDS